MNIDSIIAEWTYRLEKGYPDCPEDYIELRNVLREQTDLSIEEQDAIVRRAQGLTEDEEQDVEQPLTSGNDIKILIKAIRDVSEQYARYLKIFNLFDPNSLGTISEVLLAQLISKQGGNAIRVGGSQGLTDVIVNDKRISLKTTAASAPINLGSDLRLSNIQNINTVLAYAKSLFFEEAGYRKLTIKDLLNTEPTIPSEYDDTDGIYPVNIVNPEGKIVKKNKSYTEINDDYNEYKRQHRILANEIENRIKAIAKKLSGQDEYFVWAAKNMSTIEGKKVISSIIIHVLNYDKQEVINRLNNGTFFVSNDYTGVSWGIKDNNGKGMVGADKDGKYLNILPAFVKDTNQKEQQIKIDLGLSYVNLEELTPQQLVSDSFLKVLETVSKELFGEPIPGQATDGENDNLSGREG